MRAQPGVVVLEKQTQAIGIIRPADKAPVLPVGNLVFFSRTQSALPDQEPNAVGPFGIALIFGDVANFPCIFTFMYTRNMMK